MKNFINKNIKSNKENKVKHITNKVFPHLLTEMGLVLILICLPWYASKAIHTATTGQEMELLNTNTNQLQQIDLSTPVVSEHPAELIINGLETEASTKTIEFSVEQICFIGDERFSNINQAITTDAKFITGNGAGLNWLATEGMLSFNESDTQEICVVGIGLNDIDKANDYIGVLNDFADKYPNKFFVFTTVTPVDETKCKTISNEQIDVFNQTIISGLNEKWQVIDSNKYFKENNFTTDDGICYSREDYIKEFVWLIDNVKTQTININ